MRVAVLHACDPRELGLRAPADLDRADLRAVAAGLDLGAASRLALERDGRRAADDLQRRAERSRPAPLCAGELAGHALARAAAGVAGSAAAASWSRRERQLEPLERHVRDAGERVARSACPSPADGVDLAEQRQRHRRRSAAARAPAARRRAATASVTGLVSAPGSSGVVADGGADPRRLRRTCRSGTAPAAHALLSRLQIEAEHRRERDVGDRRRAPGPPGTVIIGLQRRERARLGLAARAERRLELGRERSPAQSVACVRRGRPWRPSRRRPSSVARAPAAAQLDALRMKPGRSSVSANDCGSTPARRRPAAAAATSAPSGRRPGAA